HDSRIRSDARHGSAIAETVQGGWARKSAVSQWRIVSQPLPLLNEQDAEKAHQLRSRIVQTLNGDPAASPLGGAHRLGAPYSSHRAPQRVRLRAFTRCGLAGRTF